MMTAEAPVLNTGMLGSRLLMGAAQAASSKPAQAPEIPASRNSMEVPRSGWVRCEPVQEACVGAAVSGLARRAEGSACRAAVWLPVPRLRIRGSALPILGILVPTSYVRALLPLDLERRDRSALRTRRGAPAAAALQHRAGSAGRGRARATRRSAG